MNNLLELTKKTGRQNVISIGYNMKCKFVITKSVLVFENNKFHIENGGIKISVTEQDLDSEILLDTKENRNILKKAITNN